MQNVFRTTLILATSFAAACGSPATAPGIYCGERYGVEIRAEMRLDCPNERSVQEDLDRVARVAGEPERQHKLFGGYLTLYEVDDTLLHDTAGGFTDLESEIVHVATAGNERGVLRHEMLHVAFFRLTGDPDYYHVDSRWADVN